MNFPTRSFAAALAILALASCERKQPSTDTSSVAAASTVAPDSFKVAFETSKGRVVVQVKRAWAPRGADRFYQLVNQHYYDGVKFFRVLPNFMAQFGVNGDPAITAKWNTNIPDDSVKQSNLRSAITFATAGPNTRTTQLFINKRDNQRLDGMGFAPFGRIVEGMAAVDSLYMGYGEGAPGGNGPAQDRIESEGNKYLNRFFPKLDSIITVHIVKD